MRKLILAGALALAACQPTAQVSNAVSAAVIALTDVDRLVLVYTTLPRCPGATICSDPATVVRVKALAQKAHDAVKLAEANETMLSDAILAIENLRHAIPAQGA